MAGTASDTDPQRWDLSRRPHGNVALKPAVAAEAGERLPHPRRQSSEVEAESDTNEQPHPHRWDPSRRPHGNLALKPAVAAEASERPSATQPCAA